jgi:excisionase family DNA binding protein
LSDKTPAGAGASYSITEAATALALSKITVLRRVSAGVWPGGRCGRKWLVSRPFIDALVVAITTSPQVNAEAFAAEWMTRGDTAAPSGAVA